MREPQSVMSGQVFVQLKELMALNAAHFDVRHPVAPFVDDCCHRNSGEELRRSPFLVLSSGRVRNPEIAPGPGRPDPTPDRGPAAA